MPPELIKDPVMRMSYRLTREGDVLRNECFVEPGAAVPEHSHPHIEERFEVLEGDFVFRVEGQERKAGPGDRLVVERGRRHVFENTGQSPGRLVADIEPAMDMEGFFEESAALARHGAFARPGMPNLRGLLPTAEFADRYSETTVMSFPPHAVQRALFPLLARIERRRRRKSR